MRNLLKKSNKEEKKKASQKVKSVEQELKTDNNMIIFAVDSSFRMPGFAIFAIHNSEIVMYKKFHLNNKDKESENLSTGNVLLRTYNFIKNECFNEISTANDFLKKTYKTNTVSIFFAREKAFNSRGAQSEIKIFETVGILDLFIAKELNLNIEWSEIYPVTIKKQITGTAKATKQEVADNLEKYIGKQTYETDDESDATAVGIAFMLKNGVIKSLSEDK